ncbi:MAG: sn-glycerol-3-phosphate ABC transporter ATP-binding protein UgpC [Clostridiales Family XIII bacterium]|jgi:multiple sugar transport system ATP-binding protein|nr:sn-glycerol-3-phosphate ABC transporter ATP-binding protein UgpC [Clostridiales Family XIII bacterium]
MADISLKNIWKIYPGNVVAVNDFNIDIADGEFVVLVGPSGCGKSTTLRMIAGLEEISKGELRIGNRRVNDVAPKDRDIAMVFQNYALYPHMSVYNNMSFGLKLRKVPKDEIRARVTEAARILRIEDLLDRKPKALSGGQCQRVALGRAMVRDPAVFLLDEPLSNLDAKLRASMRMELIKLHRKLKATFIYVTHDQTEAMTMGDRIVVMKDGLIQQIDTPRNLYDRPCNAFVAGFIGSPQMNFIDAVAERDGAGYCVAMAENKIRIGETKDAFLDAYVGKSIRLGIRPEDMRIDPAYIAQNPSSVVRAAVDVCEMLGNEAYLHLNCNGVPLIARTALAGAIETGSALTVGIDAQKIHLFDPDTERTIPRRREAGADVCSERREAGGDV